MNPQRGLWIDCSPRTVMAPGYLERFRALGFRTGAVMLESFTKGFDPSWKLTELAKLGESFRKHDCELVITVWPEPRREYIEDLRKKLPAYIVASGAAALEQDAESNFIRTHLEGFKTMREAADAIDDVVNEFQRTLDVRSEVTTFTMHEENGPRALLSADADRAIGQGYSVRNRTHEGKPFAVPWDHKFGPGAMQRLTFERARLIPKTKGKPVISCGLAAYDQKWPGHTEEEAMLVAHDACTEFDPFERRWWSSKWVLGAKSQPYAVRFFESLVASGK